MLAPTANTIVSTRWRSADALLAIAEDSKASARERRLAAMAVLDLCDEAEAALAAQAAVAPAAAPATPRTPEHTQAAVQVQPRSHQHAPPVPQPVTPQPAAAQVVIHQSAGQRTPVPPLQPPSRADHAPAQPRAA